MFRRFTDYKNKLVRRIKSNPARRKGKDKKKLTNKSVDTSGKSKIISRMLPTVIIISFILVLISIFRVYQSLEFNKYNDNQISKTDWNGVDRLNILIIGIDTKDSGLTLVDHVSVLHFNPEIPKVGIFNVTPYLESKTSNQKNTTIRLSFDIGKEDGNEIMNTVSSVENLLGLRLDKYILLDTNQFQNIVTSLPNIGLISNRDVIDPDFDPILKDSYIENSEYKNLLASDINGLNFKSDINTLFIENMILQLPKDLQFLLNLQSNVDTVKSNIYTDLSRNDILRLAWFVRGMREDQVLRAFTKESSGVTYADNPYRLKPLYGSIDNDMKTILQDLDVSSEQARIEIFNASSVPGVATLNSRLIENIGGRVIRIGNAVDDYEKNYLYCKNPEKYSETIKEIEFAFNGNIVVLREEYPSRHIGDIVIIIADPE